MTTYMYGRLDQTRTYPGIELVMGVTQISKAPWQSRCHRCADQYTHKYYLVVTVDNIMCYICKKCLGEFGLLQSRCHEYVPVIDSYGKIKIYQSKGLSHCHIVEVAARCVKL